MLEVIRKLNEYLDEFETEIGLPPSLVINNKEEFNHYLNMNIMDLEKMDSIGCGNVAYRLTQFSLHIQRILNKENAKKRMLENRINGFICKTVGQFPYIKGELARAAAISENDAAKKLDDELLKCDIKIEELTYLSSGIQKLSDQLKNLQFSKREK